MRAKNTSRCPHQVSRVLLLNFVHSSLCDILTGSIDVSQDRRAPNILRCGLLHHFEIRSLFNTYFEKVNPSLPILDEKLQTPERLIVTSSFLFTVICALASVHDVRRPKLHRLAMELVMDDATEALREGIKTVETCQAYLLLSIFPLPNKNLTDDRRLLLMSIAARLAQELKLDQPPSPSCEERLSLNYTRTWFAIVCLDKTYAIQFGRPVIVQRSGYIAGITRTWYNSTKSNTRYDVHICAYTELHLLAAEFWQTHDRDCTEAREDLDEMSTAIEYDKKMTDLASHWCHIFYQSPDASDSNWLLSTDTIKVVVAHLRLAILSAGFQTVVKQGAPLDPQILNTCVQLAKSILRNTIESFYPAGMLPFIFEAHYLYIAFAAAFLINLRESRFFSLLHPRLQPTIVEDVEKLIDILSSNEVALDPQRTPYIFSRFLASLLRRRVLGPPLVLTLSPHSVLASG
ncbi:hypothetical protein B0H21DRAFT_3003 [Amylocystis lapponica]|nr:hypothetical protein B0H21DRAFT_3003 [Amylocystis lapponica]